MIRVVGLGAGGHAKVVIEILRASSDVEVVGLLDIREALWGTAVVGVPVLGGDRLLPELRAQGIEHVFIGVGSRGDMEPRRRLYMHAQSLGLRAVSAVHPSATISRSATIGHGVTIMPEVIVNAEARLGDNVILNSGAIVEHDCVIGDHVHIATGARLAGSVAVGEGTHVGAGACVRDSCRIGRDVIVGAGTVVVKDVPNNVVVVGSPARLLRHRAREP